MQTVHMHIRVNSDVDPLKDTIRFHSLAGVSHFHIVYDPSLTNKPAPEELALYLGTRTGTGPTFSTEIATSCDPADAAQPQIPNSGPTTPDWLIDTPATDFWLPACEDNPTLQELLTEAHHSGHSAVTVEYFHARGNEDETRTSPASTSFFDKPLPSQTTQLSAVNQTAQKAAGRQRPPGLAETQATVGCYRFKNIDAELTQHWPLSFSLTRDLISDETLIEHRIRHTLETNHWPTPDTALLELADSTQKIDKPERTNIARFSTLAKTERESIRYYHEVPFHLAGTIAQKYHFKKAALKWQPPLAQNFSTYRDYVSISPSNPQILNHLAQCARRDLPEDFARLEHDLKGKKIVVLHTTCRPNIDNALASEATFAGLEDTAHIKLVGNSEIHGLSSEESTPFSFAYKDGLLEVPPADNYESLAKKIFYAYMVLSLVDGSFSVLKADDDIRLASEVDFLKQIERVEQQNLDVLGVKFAPVGLDQIFKFGWHIGKTSEEKLSEKGYQYPLAQRFPAGGRGYILGPRGLKACSLAYLSMKAFFDMDSIPLEDGFVGHCVNHYGLRFASAVASHDPHHTIPGLTLDLT